MDQLLWALRNEKQNAAVGLGQNLANIYNQQKDTEFKQAATKWFGDGEITADKIQQFLEYYPNHQADVLQIAGQAASRKTAQAMSDAGKSFMSFMKSKDMKKMTPEDIQTFMETDPYLSSSPQAAEIFLTKHVPQLLQIQKQYEPTYKEFKPGHRYDKSVGGQPTGETIYGPTEAEKADQIVMKPDGKGAKQVTLTEATKLINEQGYVPYKAPAQEKPFEVNVANEIETILAQKYPGYYTDKAVRDKALRDYGSDPELSKSVLEEASQYARSKAAPYITVLQTGTGISKLNNRTGEITPASTPEGTPLAKPLPVEAMKSLGDLGALKKQVESAKALYKPQYVGPVAGNAYSVAEKVVNLPKDQVKFYSYVRDMKDALLRARSGAQINEQEYARMVQFLPSETLPPENFMARMERFDELLDTLISAKTSVYKGQGYNPGGSNIPTGKKPLSAY